MKTLSEDRWSKFNNLSLMFTFWQCIVFVDLFAQQISYILFGGGCFGPGFFFPATEGYFDGPKSGPNNGAGMCTYIENVYLKSFDANHVIGAWSKSKSLVLHVERNFILRMQIDLKKQRKRCQPKDISQMVCPEKSGWELLSLSQRWPQLPWLQCLSEVLSCIHTAQCSEEVAVHVCCLKQMKVMFAKQPDIFLLGFPTSWQIYNHWWGGCNLSCSQTRVDFVHWMCSKLQSLLKRWQNPDWHCKVVLTKCTCKSSTHMCELRQLFCFSM